MMRSVNLITLGCSKNLFDSERVLNMLKESGFDARYEQSAPADIVVINTCGFIGDAKEESIDTILEILQEKARGNVKEVYVMGCLSERYRKDLMVELPEVDGFYGKFDWVNLADDLAQRHNSHSAFRRCLTTPYHYTYLKIAEGCNRYCAFCAIPLITGKFKSRTIDEIICEVKELVAKGVKEFNVIAQDLSGYGKDIYGKLSLAELIEQMAQVEGVKWIRLHYAYPTEFPQDIMEVMAKYDNVCSYLDIALQHSSDRMLDRMKRHISSDSQKKLLSELRSRVPGIHIRTTLMVGFPGETEEDFEDLKQFVKEQRFERMGAFMYCEEEGTFAANNYENDVPDDIKQKRLDELMALQEKISLEIQEGKIGKVLEVVIDREEDEYYVGRTQWDSPEVDPEVLIEKIKPLRIGYYYDVKIKEALPFELIAEPL